MEYNEKEWIRIDEEIRIENIAFNIKLIKALWKLRHGSYGERIIKGNENDPTNLYGTLEKSQEILRQWELHRIDLKMEKIFRWAKMIEEKTDIPGEYLSGQEMIDISFLGGGGPREYEVFWKAEEHLYDLIDELENHERIEIKNKEINLDEAKAKRMTLSEIESYLMKLDVTIKNQFLKIISEVELDIKVMKEYDNNLDNALRKLLVDDFETKLFNKNRKLYRLIFFIYRKKKCGTGNSIIELIRVLNDKHVGEMAEVGEEMLYKYILALRNQLKLAEATYIVATDTRKFNNEKNYKKIIN